MTVDDLIAALDALNVTLRVEDGKLRFRAPAGAMTPQLQSAARTHRDALIARLTPKPNGLSAGELRLWLAHHLAPTEPAYNVSAAFQITGPLDSTSLERAFKEVVQRHPSLRTSFVDHPDGPLLRVLVDVTLNFERVNATHIAAEDREAFARSMAEARASAPFDLAVPPLLRECLISFSATEHVLIHVIHHIITDGWSHGIFCRELSEAYNRHVSGDAESTQEWSSQGTALRLRPRAAQTKQIDWLANLRQLSLPRDAVVKSNRRFAGGTLMVLLDSSINTKAQQLASSSQTTPATVYLAAYLLLLAALSRSQTPVTAMPVAARTDPAMFDHIGYHANTVLVAAPVEPQDSFKKWLAHVHHALGDALTHQSIPFDDLVRATFPDDISNHDDTFTQSSFAYQAMPDATLALSGLDIKALGFERGVTRFDIEMHIWPDDDTTTSALLEPAPSTILPSLSAAHSKSRQTGNARATLTYNLNNFTRDGAARLLRQYVSILDACVAAPTSSLEVITRQALTDVAPDLSTLSNLRPHPLATTNIASRFEHIANTQPDRIAIEEGTARLTYGELERVSRELAERIMGTGLQPSAIVGVLMDRSADAIVALIATIRAGAAYLPLDPSYPDARLELMLSNTKAFGIVASSALQARAEKLHASVVGFGPDRSAVRASLPEAEAAKPNAPAYINFTSGSTGNPKAVCIPHGAVLNLVIDTDYAELTPADRIAQAATLSFDAATFEIWGGILNGATVVLIEHATLLDPAALSKKLASSDISVLFLTTALFNQVAVAEPRAFGGLRLMLFGGEVVNVERVRNILSNRPPRRLLHVYGPTEATTFTTFHHIAELPDQAAAVPIGRPIQGVLCRVVDESLRICAPGVAGELLVSGAGLATGYIDDAALTAERFVCTDDGSRWYRTGDIVRVDPSAAIEFLGRRDSQVKIRGHRIEPEEIEAVLGKHPEVVLAAIVVTGAEENKNLNAFVKRRPGASTSTRAIRQHLAQQLPAYLMPKSIEFVDDFALTATGKIDRAALCVSSSRPAIATPPRSDLEREVLMVWSDVLGRAVGPLDDFFDSGGHSLLAARMTMKLRKVTGCDIPIPLVFEVPTARDFTTRIESMSRSEGDDSSIGDIKTDPVTTLSFAQNRLWFLERLSPGTAGYNVPFAYDLHGQIDTARLQHALDQIIARHAPLRSRIFEKDGVGAQEPLPDAACPLSVVDLSNVGEEQALRDVPSHLRESALVPFDLTAPPLMRAHLFKLSTTRSILLLVVHHIACDGWSMTILTRDLSMFYSGEKPNELPIAYAQFAQWQRDWLSGARARKQLATWSSRLNGLPELRLTYDYRRPEQQTYKGNTVPLHINAKLTHQLRTLAAETGATPFMVLLAAFGQILATTSGQEDFAVACPIANRHRAETEDLIGFFVNTLALRLDHSGAPTLRELVGRVRGVALEAFANQDLPFEQLIERLHPHRDAARNPLVQVAFALQNATDDRIVFPGVTAAPFALDIRTTRFDIEVHLFDRGDHLEGLFVYATELFDIASSEQLARGFIDLLSNGLERPDLPIAEACPSGDLVRLPTTLDRMLSRTRPCPGNGHDLSTLFEHVANTHPDRPAIETANATLTYRDLEQQTAALARHIIDAGVQPGDTVGIFMDRSPDAIIALVACIRASAAYMPIDPKLPNARVRMMLSATNAAAIIYADQLSERAADLHLTRVRFQNRYETGDRPLATISRDPSQAAAYINFTSGSTGRPKAILIPHGAVINLVVDTDYAQLTDQDRIAQAATLSFDAATFEIWGALLNGACIVPINRETLLDPTALFHRLSETRTSVLFLTTAVLNQVANVQPAALRGLRLVLFGGEAVNPDRVRAICKAGRPEQLLHVYGPTETTTFATYHAVTEILEDAATVPIGLPLPGVSCVIVDDALRPVPSGTSGELLIGGAGIALEYVGDPQATTTCFITGKDGSRLYRTGDIVRINSEGTINFIGRRDSQVKIRGHRIELEEIEATLTAHPMVANAAVIVAGSDENKFLQAAVEPASDVDGAHDTHAQSFIDDWMALYEDTYVGPFEDPDADLAGWNDSYDGQPIPAEEMREWQNATAQVLLETHPRRVLEIGCGTGLLMQMLAPNVESYFGTDLSPPAVHRARALAQQLGFNNVTTEHRAADDFENLTDKNFDLIILNSVIQYFPNSAYLDRVLNAALACLSTDGRIYVGDVRSLPLQKQFAASVEWSHARESGAGLDRLTKNTLNRVRLDKELVVDPMYFVDFCTRWNGLVTPRLSLKRGDSINELTKYRYEAVLERRQSAERVPAQLEWNQLASTQTLLDAVQNMTMPVCITDVPDARQLNDRDALEAVGFLLDGQSAPEAPRPEFIAEKINALGLIPYFAVSPRSAEGVFDLLITQKGKPRPVSPLEAKGATPRSAQRLTNRPLQNNISQTMVPALKEHLASHLPDYMIPGQIVLVSELPLTETGKIDRRIVASLIPSFETDHLEAPQGATEADIAAIWCELLQINSVARDTNFFDAGGHSLLLVQVQNRINAKFGCKLQLIDLFRATTVAALALLTTHGTVDQIAATDAAVQDRVQKRRDALGRRQRRM